MRTPADGVPVSAAELERRLPLRSENTCFSGRGRKRCRRSRQIHKHNREAILSFSSLITALRHPIVAHLRVTEPMDMLRQLSGTTMIPSTDRSYTEPVCALQLKLPAAIIASTTNEKKQLRSREWRSTGTTYVPLTCLALDKPSLWL